MLEEQGRQTVVPPELEVSNETEDYYSDEESEDEESESMSEETQ